MRVFIAMVFHETNTFSAIATDRRQFEARDLRDGGEILEAYLTTGTCLGGMIDGAAQRGLTLLPSIAAVASPAGRVAKDFYADVKSRLRAGGAPASRSPWEARSTRAKGPMFRGREGRLGPTAVLDVDDVKAILISNRWRTLDPEMIRFVGSDPLGERRLVVKSTIHSRAAFEAIVQGIIEVDGPGLSSSNLGGFDFTRVRRPIFPLDDL